MCLAAAYHGEKKEPLLREVALVRVEGDRIELESLFGERKVVEGKITEVDFSNSRLVID
ncbi:MAG: CooT family nickel-binding protein [Dehalococcoidia bacterium]|nr:CooT family nickel-binding protein [Dehalococcoidia bacterium]